jgi:hypothetical protein
MNRSIFLQPEKMSLSGDDKPCLAFCSQGEKDVIEWFCLDFSWIIGRIRLAGLLQLLCNPLVETLPPVYNCLGHLSA